jgi:hypothetical protein
MLIAAPAQAQTATVLYNFTGSPDGANPMSSLTSDGAGNFYGTTNSGGEFGYGTVFGLSPNGSGDWNETVLYSFCVTPNCSDGASPTYSSLVFDSIGNLYGIASEGGTYGYGVVFELSPMGTSWTETVLYDFANDGDGAYPQNGLIFDKTGNLYGTTCNCGSGSNGSGGVFELSQSDGRWLEQLIYPVYATSSYAGVTLDAAGNIFGTTLSTVFELSPNGSGGWNSTVIYTFTTPQDGQYPQGTLALDTVGNLYGTAFSGGAGYGMIYKLSLGKKGWKEQILHNFHLGPKDGANPWAGVALGADGNVYGTTTIGTRPLRHKFQLGAGTVFELVASSGKGTYKEELVSHFIISNGWTPESSLILDSAGNLYGTTPFGGTYYPNENYGVVFEVTP